MTALEFGKRTREKREKIPAAEAQPVSESAEKADLDLIETLLKKDAALRDLLMEAYGIIALEPDAHDDQPLTRSFEDIKERIEDIQPGRGTKMDKETIRKFLVTRTKSLA
jgi:3-hydroxyisobutyrate dehydrogenase-like beta-hydroxyacid dehydrogenase